MPGRGLSSSNRNVDLAGLEYAAEIALWGRAGLTHLGKSRRQVYAVPLQILSQPEI
ncbi:hypothetical protein ES703_52066 [subsurface metagenome]